MKNIELKYQYREHLKEYSVEEDGYFYYMPISYIVRLQAYFDQLTGEDPTPVKSWYVGLKELERRIVSRKTQDEDKESSIW